MTRRSILLLMAAVLLIPAVAIAQETTTVMWSDHETLGTILTDSEGMTLYIFTRDEDGESTCYDQCAQNWPPLTVEGEPEAADDVTGTLGTTERDDGELQVTYDGMPLYYFAGDSEPGDATGEGVNDVWFVIQAEAATGGATDEQVTSVMPATGGPNHGAPVTLLTTALGLMALATLAGGAYIRRRTVQ